MLAILTTDYPLMGVVRVTWAY